MIQAAFSFQNTSIDLSVAFADRSFGSVASRVWDFGFKELDVEKTSTEKNPIIAFPEAGKYQISLIITGSNLSDGTSTTQQELLIYPDGLVSYSLIQLILSALPTGYVPDLNYILQEIIFWQNYLNDTLNPPLTGNDINDESKWPPLYNALISRIILYQIAVNSFRGSFLLTSGGSDGGIKRITMGPAETEFFSISEGISKVVANGDGESFLDLYRIDACTLAGRLGVRLPFCPLSSRPVMFEIFKVHPSC